MSAALRVRRLAHAAGLPLPSYQTPGAAGMDVVAALEDELVLGPLERAAVPTGLAFAVPDGFELQVRARSGRAMREGLALVNAPGTVDADYRGEVLVLVVNLGREPITLRRGERIAQFVLCPVARAEVVEVDALDETERGRGGFGSTGR